MRSGYEKIYESLLPELGKCDLSEAAGRLGLSFRPDGGISVDFLGREYEISSRGVNPTDGKPVDVINRIVLAYYALSKGEGEPAFSYVPVSDLTGAKIAFNVNLKWMTAPLGEIFSGDYEGFCEIMRSLGGVFNGRQNSGGYAWFLKVLPKIPLQIVYYHGDDEFPCEIQILFDKNASRFMEFECLAFLEGCVVKALSTNAEAEDASG